MKFNNTTPKTFSDIFKGNFNAMMSLTHTCMPGAIIDYEGGRICSVKPHLQRKLKNGSYLDLPVIEEVPLIFPGSSEFSLSFPLKRGDPVLILFSERSIEEWIERGEPVQPEDVRRFSLCDAVAIPGLFNKGTDFPDSNNEDVQIIYKDAHINLKSDGNVEINGNTKSFVTYAEMNTALQAHITKYNQDMALILAGATAAIAASGLWASPLTGLGVDTLDMSASETTTIKTGG